MVGEMELCARNKRLARRNIEQQEQKNAPVFESDLRSRMDVFPKVATGPKAVEPSIAKCLWCCERNLTLKSSVVGRRTEDPAVEKGGKVLSQYFFHSMAGWVFGWPFVSSLEVYYVDTFVPSHFRSKTIPRSPYLGPSGKNINMRVPLSNNIHLSFLSDYIIATSRSNVCPCIAVQAVCCKTCT